ncbi:MAG: hypothetical protein H6765_05840 [Candidatus Peribacteria bacterium]|nr:MAG: hypothetical protein H6765_05840 [Candidatus Peribacteria bacterium]
MQTIPGQCTVEGMVNFEEFFSYTEFTCLSDDDCPENVSLGHGNFSEYACDLSQSVLGSQGTCECEQFIFPGCGN